MAGKELTMDELLTYTKEELLTLANSLNVSVDAGLTKPKLQILLISRLFPSKVQLPPDATAKSVASSTDGDAFEDTSSVHEADKPTDKPVEMPAKGLEKPTSKHVDPSSVFDLNTSDHGSNHGDDYFARLDADLQGDMDAPGVPWNVRLELHKFAREREREARDREDARQREAREYEREREARDAERQAKIGRAHV